MKLFAWIKLEIKRWKARRKYNQVYRYSLNGEISLCPDCDALRGDCGVMVACRRNRVFKLKRKYVKKS